MRITKIEIERFRGIRKLTTTVPGNVQLIAGANNSGKSTVISALDLFFQGEEGIKKAKNLSPKNAYYVREGSRALTTIKIWFSNLSTNDKKDYKDAISKRSNSFWCKVKVSRNGEVAFSCSGTGNATELYKKLISRYTIFHVPVLRVSNDGFSSTENHRFIQTIRDVLIRNRPGPKSKYQKKYEDHYKKVSNLIGRVLSESKEAASNLLPSDSEIKFKFPNAGMILENILKEITIQSRPKFDLSTKEEGTGYQSLLALGLLKHIVELESSRRNQSTLILLEEPEAYLHPQFQRKVISYIRDLSKNSQLIVSTHSPTIIDAAEIQNIMRIERDPSGLNYDWNPEHLSANSKGKLSRWCDAKNSELIFSDKVIFCEGFSDAVVIRKIIEQSQDLNNLSDNLSVIAMGGRDNPDVFAELTLRFNVPSLFIFDRDIYTGNRSTLKKLCNTIGVGLSKRDTEKFERLKRQACFNLEESAAMRRDANVGLIRRNIFVFASDIEGAVATSYPKKRILDELLSIELIDNQQKEILSTKQGADYYDGVFDVIGSKGWNMKKVKNKSKPHIPGLIVEDLSTQFTQNSDLAKLKQVLKQFLKNKKRISV